MFERTQFSPPATKTARIGLGVAVCSFAGLVATLAVFLAADAGEIVYNSDWTATPYSVGVSVGQTLMLAAAPAVFTVAYLKIHPSVTRLINTIGNQSAWPRLRAALETVALASGTTAAICAGNAASLVGFILFTETTWPLDVAPTLLHLIAATGILVAIFSVLPTLFSLAFLAVHSRFAQSASAESDR